MSRKKYKVVNGKSYKLCGGYVSWDSRKKDQEGYPLRVTKEVHVWVRCGVDVSDCGPGTKLLVKKLEEKVLARVACTRNVECRESWEC